MNDKDLKDIIKDDGDKLEIPDRLCPENIEQELNKKKKISFKPFRRYMPVVAAVFVCLLIPFTFSTMGRPGSDTEASVSSSESKDGDVPAISLEEAFKGAFYTASSEAELKDRIESSNRRRNENRYRAGDEEVFAEDAAAVNSAAMQAAGARDTGTTGAIVEDLAKESVQNESEVLHSETNTREAGVDEGDIIKTDGKYIYLLKKASNQVNLVDISGSGMKVVSKIALSDYIKESSNIAASEIYLADDVLIILSDYTENSLEAENSRIAWNADKSYTSALFFDISERTDPKNTGSITQSGYYVSSRLKNGYLYTFSRDQGNDIPYVCNDVVTYGDVYLGKTEGFYNAAHTITSVKIDDPKEPVDTKCIYSDIQDMYVSNGSIYLQRGSYNPNIGDTTDIFKLSYADGKVWPVATASVNGSINDSFSIDEGREEILRIAVTNHGNNGNNYHQINAVYTFDKELKALGSIEDIAPGETIKSARYIGDMLYLVTFKNTDPVFSIDLSDPREPKILGELKIPGFSAYLHPWSDGRLLGIGYMVDETSEWAKITGMKLSMFDLADPGDVKEEDVANYPGNYNIPSLYEYKKILVDSRKNLIGFAIEKQSNTINGASYSKPEAKYALFSYEEGRFKMNYLFDISDPYGVSAVYAGNNIYVFDVNKLTRFDLSCGNVDVNKPDEVIGL